jgi:hypothetical protein
MELMVSTAVLLLVLGGFMALFISAMRTQVISGDYYRATCIARNRIERSRSLDYSSLPLMSETNMWVDDDGNAKAHELGARFLRSTIVTNAGTNAMLINVSVQFPVPNGKLSPAAINVQTMVAKGI